MTQTGGSGGNLGGNGGGRWGGRWGGGGDGSGPGGSSGDWNNSFGQNLNGIFLKSFGGSSEPESDLETIVKPLQS